VIGGTFMGLGDCHETPTPAWPPCGAREIPMTCRLVPSRGHSRSARRPAALGWHSAHRFCKGSEGRVVNGASAISGMPYTAMRAVIFTVRALSRSLGSAKSRPDKLALAVAGNTFVISGLRVSASQSEQKPSKQALRQERADPIT